MIRLRDLRHTYQGLTVLDVPELTIAHGEHTLLLGPSGSGKTTLLHILGGLLRPTEGTVVVEGQDLGALDGAALDRWRGRHVGIVFQELHLVDALTVEQNLLLAPFAAGVKQDRARVRKVLDRLSIAHKADAHPDALSVGQRQRVALARAVMNHPALLLADEPTAALDDAHARDALALLMEQADVEGATLVVATHDARVAEAFAHRLELPARAAVA